MTDHRSSPGAFALSRFSMMRVAVFASACLLVGVQTAEAKAPPDLTKTLAEMSKIPTCTSVPVVMAKDPDSIESMRRRGLAVPIDFCNAALPASFKREMISRKLSFDCVFRYDVDRQGKGALAETRCEFKAAKEIEPEWRSYFQSVILAALDRASPRLKFEPAPEYEQRPVRPGIMFWALDAKAVETEAVRRIPLDSLR